MKLKRAFVVLDSAPSARPRSGRARRTWPFPPGWRWFLIAGLLAEVAGLVEWPVPLMGRIAEAEFLDLPPEVLQTSMKEHQKFFSVRNPKTGVSRGS